MTQEALTARARALEARFPRSRFGALLGITIRYDDELRPVVTLPHDPKLSNTRNGVHGGVLATLIDVAAWCAAAVHYPSWVSTIELQAQLLERSDGEDLVATGQVVRTGKRIAVSTAEVRTASGRLVAVGGATLSVTRLPIG